MSTEPTTPNTKQDENIRAILWGFLESLTGVYEHTDEEYAAVDDALEAIKEVYSE